MADFPLFGGVRQKTIGVSSVTARGTTVTSGAIDTKGAFVELLSAANNTHASSEISAVIEKVEGALCNTYIDIAIGESGFEKVIIPDLFYFGDAGLNTILDNFTFPKGIPRDIRISARSQSNIASQPVIVGCRLTRGNFTQGSPLQKLITYGLQSGTSGTVVTQGVAGFGSYVEIVASTDHDISGFVVSCHRAASSWSNGGIIYKVAIGAAGFEVDLAGPFQTITNASETAGGLVSPFNNICIPRGSRISIATDATTANADFTYQFTVTGVA